MISRVTAALADGLLIRRENPADIEAIHVITAAAFARPGAPAGEVPPEATLVEELRAGPAWLPALSLVATTLAGEVTGHVLCTRGHVAQAPVLALGPLSVRPDHQGRGVGSALMHAVLGAAEALGEPLVGLLGEPAYYRRFGFRPATAHEITPPNRRWGGYFQVRTLTACRPSVHGPFAYPEPFDRL